MQIDTQKLFNMLDCITSSHSGSASFSCFGCPAFVANNIIGNKKIPVHHFRLLGPRHEIYCSEDIAYRTVAKYLIDLADNGDGDAIDLLSDLVGGGIENVLYFIREQMDESIE